MRYAELFVFCLDAIAVQLSNYEFVVCFNFPFHLTTTTWVIFSILGQYEREQSEKNYI